MLSLRPENREMQKGEIELNAYAIFAVNEHLEFLLEEAARNRTPKAHKPGLRARVASAVDKVRSSVAITTYETTSIFPKLEDYPYRS
jgi:ethanolamine ammonia-lyase large subunit